MRADVFSCLFVAAGACAGFAVTPTWPAFHGPNSSGVSSEARPPVKISPTNSVVWKIEVPWSPSAPSIWDDRLFLTTFAEGELQTRCYRRSDGKLAWSRALKPDSLEMFHKTESSPAASTPALDGKHVVTYFGSFGLVCHDSEGKELWRHPLPVALSLGGYGTATSPLIAGDLAIVMRDRDEGSSLLAVKLETGKKVWETARPDSYGSFGTPIVWKNDGVDEVVVPGSLRLKGYALGTGKEDWQIGAVTAFACTTPVVGDGMRFFAAWADGKADAPWTTSRGKLSACVSKFIESLGRGCSNPHTKSAGRMNF